MSLITRPTITETFLERVNASPSIVAFQYKPTYTDTGPLVSDVWKQVTFKEFYKECRLVSYGLMGLKIQPGDKVVILSNTRYEWSLCDMAILGAKAITVPIYASNTPDDVVFIAEHSDARVMIIEDAKQLQKILDKRLENPACLPKLEKIVSIHPSAMILASRHLDASKNVMTLQALKELGRREEAKDPSRFDQNLTSAKFDDVITICYTSGTTGVPKGVVLTHDNLMSVLEDCAATLGPFMKPEGEVVLSFLPVSHIFGKVESLAIYTFGWKQAFAENLDRLMANMAEVHPTLLISVPRIFEKAYNRLQGLLESGSPRQKKLFRWALKVGRRYYSSVWAKQKPSLRDRLEYQAAKSLVFSKVAQRFGGELRFAICGGAPLPKEIGEFFQIVGIQILEGYGLTETCAPVSLNSPDAIQFGAVGRPLPEVSFRIADDGEVLVKSRKVFNRYFKMEKETAQVLSDGWFTTGDIGYIDADGFLHITDRKKDLIVTSGGKNIAPQKIENIAKTQKWVSQFVVHGDRRHYLTAIMTLDPELIVQYANENQILFSEYAELIKNPKIISLAQKIIDEINKKLASFESIKKFVVLPNEFTVETGELTPSLKVRRSYINQHYKAVLDSMYADSVRVPLDSSPEIR
jgi:long-chain acyl-CoA synthetase